MKVLIAIIALIYPALAFADVDAGIEGDFIYSGGERYSLGGYLGLTKQVGFVQLGPKLSGGLFNTGAFGEGEVGLYGDAAIALTLGTKLQVIGEVGYGYEHLADNSSHGVYFEGGAAFPLGSTLGLNTTVRVDEDFNHPKFAAGFTLAF